MAAKQTSGSGRWMLYGANGYTGELIAEEACRRGEAPVLAGRRAEAIAPIAERLGLEYRVFAVEDAGSHLADVDAVLLAAGPFARTSAPMVEACLATGTHYLDITGEIEVFEACHRRTEVAAAAGVVLLPGVGFDVVPSDCLAASLAAALPGAGSLELAFRGVGSPSQGTAKTMVEGLPRGGAVREGGDIRPVPIAYAVETIPFRDKPRTAVTIPWGDVSTAYYSTGIPDIRVYMAMPPRMIRALKLARPVAPLLGKRPVQRLLKGLIERRVAGPDENTRRSARAHLWGRVVRRSDGASVQGTLVTPEAYQLTVLTALESARRVAAGQVAPGTHTPSTAFGAGYITEFEDCSLVIDEVVGAAA